MPEIRGRKILEDFQASQVKSAWQTMQKNFPSAKKSFRELEMLEPQRTNEESQQQTQGVKRKLTYQIHSIQYLMVGKRKSLSCFSFLSGFLCVQIPCTRKIPCSKLHDPAVPSLHNRMLPDGIIIHLVSSPNSFTRSNFTSLKTIKYGLCLRGGYVRLHLKSL